ncbi:DUF6802 family protein [Rhodococcus sp. NPDC003348]
MQDEMLMMGLLGEHSVSVESGPADGDIVLFDPTVDLDGDGILDTRAFADADGVTVVSDLDGDGRADHLTRVEGDGGYAAWEPRRDADGTVRWDRTDLGQL